MLHAVFHRALVGAHFVVAALQQGPAPGIHALGNLVVFQTGFHVSGLLGLNKLALESGNFFRVIKLHHIECFVNAHGVQRRDRQHMGVPLEHDVGVVGEPDGALAGLLLAAVGLQRVLPALVDRAAGTAPGMSQTNGLHRVVLFELPLQVFAADKATQAGVKRPHVVVLQVDLDEGFPVVVALVQFDPIEHKAGEVEFGARPHAGQIGLDVATVVLKQQAIPFPQRVVVEVQAGILREMGRTEQQPGPLCGGAAVGPAVQRAHHIARGAARPGLLQGATALQHQGLPVPANIGDQLNAGRRSNQGAALVFMGQSGIVAQLGHTQGMAQVARPGVEQTRLFALKQRLITIT